MGFAPASQTHPVSQAPTKLSPPQGRHRSRWEPTESRDRSRSYLFQCPAALVAQSSQPGPHCPGAREKTRSPPCSSGRVKAETVQRRLQAARRFRVPVRCHTPRTRTGNRAGSHHSCHVPCSHLGSGLQRIPQQFFIVTRRGPAPLPPPGVCAARVAAEAEGWLRLGRHGGSHARRMGKSSLHQHPPSTEGTWRDLDGQGHRQQVICARFKEPLSARPT